MKNMDMMFSNQGLHRFVTRKSIDEKKNGHKIILKKMILLLNRVVYNMESGVYIFFYFPAILISSFENSLSKPWQMKTFW